LLYGTAQHEDHHKDETMPMITLPSLQSLSLTLGGQGPTLSLVLLTVGVIFMLMGLRIYTALIVASFGVVGFFLGRLVPVEGWLNWLCAGGAAIVFAALSVYMMRAAVAILAGGWAGVATAALTQPVVGQQLSLIAGGVAMVTALSLTFVLFEQLVAFVTSLEGSVLVVCGLTLLLGQNTATSHLIDDAIGKSGYFAAFLIGGGTVIGYYAQMAESQKKKAGTTG
jgi:hypothetical protein